MVKIYFLLAFILFSLGIVTAQNSSIIVAKAFDKASIDSSYIAVNKRAGWKFLISHLTLIKTDSVLIEMVLKNNFTLDLKQEQLVGRIKSESMLPKTSQTSSFNVTGLQYKLRIEPDGKCYLLLTTGSLIIGDPIIIPVRAMYKL